METTMAEDEKDEKERLQAENERLKHENERLRVDNETCRGCGGRGYVSIFPERWSGVCGDCDGTGRR